MDEPKKHHFLPQFYLKGFQTLPERKTPQIVVYEKHSELCNSYISSIKDTGCQRDYHSLDYEEEEKDRKTVEGLLSDLETLHSELIKSIIQKRAISSEDKLELAFFLNLMRCRVPSIKNYIEKIHKDVVEITTNNLLKRGLLPEPPKVVQNLIDKGESWYSVEIYNWKLIQGMLEMASSKEIINLIFQMNFSLIKAFNDNWFITSDSPVSFYFPDYKGPYGAGGIAFKPTEMFIPLNKEYGLLCSWKDYPPFKEATVEEIYELNRRTLIMAENNIYSCVKNQQINEMIQKYKHIRAGIQVDKLEYDKGGYSISRTIPITD